MTRSPSKSQGKLSLVPREPWMQTFTGQAVNLVYPTRDQISIVDLAHHLSLECRFAGACKFHYSVAQHSYLMATQAAKLGESLEIQLECLLHDAHEAYVKDVHAPLVWAMEHEEFGDVQDRVGDPYKIIKRRFDELIRSMWQLPMEKTRICHSYDMMMLFTEREQLMTHAPYPWVDETAWPPFDLKIVQWTPTMAEKTWLLELKRLTEVRFG